MRNGSNSSQEFDGDDDEAAWEFEDDDWEEDSIHARKEHQDHRGRAKGHVRRDIEYYKDKKQLKELLGDDFDD
ncbi:hypothetical protein [Psychromonas sp. MME2]|uniref:hypothetical protein n=1 Tax=unclassified Psychromonas TaxID=2614957 RepID=UPI00339BC849